jgi:hypothetical protein
LLLNKEKKNRGEKESGLCTRARGRGAERVAVEESELAIDGDLIWFGLDWFKLGLKSN